MLLGRKHQLLDQAFELLTLPDAFSTEQEGVFITTDILVNYVFLYKHPNCLLMLPLSVWQIANNNLLLFTRNGQEKQFIDLEVVSTL